MQTAPTPARTCGTARPTNGTRVVTPAPDWPVAGSIAHSENVEYCGSPSSLMVTPSAARCCAKVLRESTQCNRATMSFMALHPHPSTSTSTDQAPVHLCTLA